MAISSAGVGSGLDVSSIVTQQMKIEKQPLTQLQTKATSLQSKLSAYGTVKSALSTFQDAAKALLDTSGWQAKTFTSNNTSAITGSATTSALATSFSVQVDTLAKAQSVRSSAVTAGSAIGADGRLDIELGTWSGTSFAAGSGGTVSVSISATDKLSDIASKINSANAGVNAVVVSSSSGDQLLIRGKDTGAASGFRIRSYDGSSAEITDGTTGVGKLAYNHNGTAFYGQTQTQAAVDASIQIDGITVTSATNTVSNAVPGVTLNLLTTTSSATTVSIADDTKAIKTRINTFQSAYNSLNATLKDLTKYDATTKVAGTLQGDNTAVGLQNAIRSMLGSSGPAGTSFNRLSDIGLEIQRDGSMTVNSTKLDAALKKTDDLNTFFTASTGDSATDGMARRLNTFIQQALGVDGNVQGRSKALQDAISRNNKDQDKLNTRLTQRQAALYAQFNALDTKMGTLSSLNSFVTQQIAQWNK